ncbi:acyl carrier protein [Streptomyces johnsoniae]|uniref:Acyl carrier protein n=1 Tax=Streptomyces johnsoniae TaxID=3075532 RepID=A0ABU2S257_9ACTN|nr:acyl carrier protein [Streptomyces sp. DSM 41886]MDT0443078.1 acyl carrier protein [Streptomyces sp. DSM 41886]
MTGAPVPDRAELARIVRETVSDVLGTEPEDIHETTDLKGDFDIDSLELMDIGARLETALRVGIPVSDLTGAATVGQAIDLLADRLERPE